MHAEVTHDIEDYYSEKLQKADESVSHSSVDVSTGENPPVSSLSYNYCLLETSLYRDRQHQLTHKYNAHLGTTTAMGRYKYSKQLQTVFWNKFPCEADIQSPDAWLPKENGDKAEGLKRNMGHRCIRLLHEMYTVLHDEMREDFYTGGPILHYRSRQSNISVKAACPKWRQRTETSHGILDTWDTDVSVSLSGSYSKCQSSSIASTDHFRLPLELLVFL